MSHSDPCPCCNTDWCDKDCPGWVEARRYLEAVEALGRQLSRVCRMLEAEGRDDTNDPLFCAAAGLPEPPSPKAVERHPAVVAAREALERADQEDERLLDALGWRLRNERTTVWGAIRRRRLRRGWSACPPVALERSQETGAICLVGGE